MNMRDKNAKPRMESLFVIHHALLRRNGLSWLLETNENVAVSHIISAIRPKTLKNRLQSDLDFAHYGLQKDFRGFMKHAVRLSESFQIVYSVPQYERPTKHPSRPVADRGMANI